MPQPCHQLQFLVCICRFDGRRLPIEAVVVVMMRWEMVRLLEGLWGSWSASGVRLLHRLTQARPLAGAR